MYKSLVVLLFALQAHAAPPAGCYRGTVKVTANAGESGTRAMDARLLFYGRKNIADNIFVEPFEADGDMFVNDLMCAKDRCALKEDSGDFAFTVKGDSLTVNAGGEWLAEPGDPSIRRTASGKVPSPAQVFKRMSKKDCDQYKKEIADAIRPAVKKVK